MAIGCAAAAGEGTGVACTSLVGDGRGVGAAALALVGLLVHLAEDLADAFVAALALGTVDGNAGIFKSAH